MKKRFVARVLVFCAIFLPLLAVGTIAGLFAALPDSTGLRHDADYLREQVRGFTRHHWSNYALLKESVQLRLRGTLYDNPEAYHRSSLIEEADGNLDKALTDMELALGLLELLPPDHTQSAAFHQRRDHLKQRLSPQGYP